MHFPKDADLQAYAEKRVGGPVVVVNTGNGLSGYLTLDYDNVQGAWRDLAVSRLARLLAPLWSADAFSFASFTAAMWLSKSNKGVHILLNFPSMAWSVRERAGLQAILGSDGLRESLSYAGAMNGERNVSVLFRPLDREVFDVTNDVLDEVEGITADY